MADLLAERQQRRSTAKNSIENVAGIWYIRAKTLARTSGEERAVARGPQTARLDQMGFC